MNRSVKRGGSGSTSSTPSPKKRRPRGSGAAMTINYGSEPSSDESSDDDLVAPFVPRVFQAMMETPIDVESDSESAEPAGFDPLELFAAPIKQEPLEPTSDVVHSPGMEITLDAEPTPDIEPKLEPTSDAKSTPDMELTPERIRSPAQCPARPIDVTPTVNTEQPRNLYDFKWKEFPVTPVSPQSRRENFSHANEGPTTKCEDPYDIFVKIWDREIMEHIASETNRYAQQLAALLIENNELCPTSRISNWCETTVDELYTYFGIVLAMGVVVRSNIKEYWGTQTDIFYTPGFGAHMTFNRFLLLGKCLHFSNNEDMSALNLSSAKAKIFKIKPVLKHLNNKFQTMYNLSQNISLDESLLMWKGWLNINHIIPNKSAKVGIKTHELCESQTGYLWRFEVQAERQSALEQNEDPLNASTPRTVLRLLRGLENRGHTIWMDNYYNSPILARRLKTLGFDCVGTLRTNRKYVPETLHALTKAFMKPGQLTGVTSGDVDLMVWRDRNRVALISTYHGNAVSKTGETIKPNLVLDYNIMMGGVDKKDQLLAMYPIERKRTKVWYKKLFRRLLNVTVLNSYIIHRKSASSPLTHRNFRLSLVRSLLSSHCSSRSIEKLPRPEKAVPPNIAHRLAKYPLGNHQRMRRQCKICKKRTHLFCVACNKTVCEHCFVTLHLENSNV